MGILKKLNNFSTQKVQAYGAEYDAFWIFMLIFYLTPPITWSYWHPGPYPNSIILGLRILSIFLGTAIAIRNFWPKKLKKYLPLFWHFTLFFWCAFRTIFILLYSQHSKGFFVNGVIGIFLLAILADEVSYTILLVLSVILTPIFFYSTGGLNTDIPPIDAFTQILWMITVVTFFKWVFFKRQYSQVFSKIKCYQQIASNIAHEMRVPLASINMASKGLDSIKSEDNAHIQKIQTHIQKLAHKAQTTIDMLLFRIGKCTVDDDIKRCSVNDCVEEALLEYPFEKGEKEKVYFKKQDDIEFLGNRRLFIHVIFNLIKNALYAINQSKKGEIFISLDALKNKLYFKDTALGICPKEANKLFQDFYTTKPEGTGMGLTFCKQTVTNIGGEITCYSEKGSFTEFAISFPKTQSNKHDHYSTLETINNNYNIG